MGPEPGQPRAGRPDAGKGTSWGSPRPLLSPLGQSARKAFPDCPEHGKGPRTQPSFQGFPASRLAPRSWEAWGGGGGSEAEGRLRPAAALYPYWGPKCRRGLPVHPRRTPKARRQQDAAPGKAISVRPPSPQPHPLLLLPTVACLMRAQPPAPFCPPLQPSRFHGPPACSPPQRPLPASAQQRMGRGGLCVLAQHSGPAVLRTRGGGGLPGGVAHLLPALQLA